MANKKDREEARNTVRATCLTGVKKAWDPSFSTSRTYTLSWSFYFSYV